MGKVPSRNQSTGNIVLTPEIKALWRRGQIVWAAEVGLSLVLPFVLPLYTFGGGDPLFLSYTGLYLLFLSSYSPWFITGPFLFSVVFGTWAMFSRGKRGWRPVWGSIACWAGLLFLGMVLCAIYRGIIVSPWILVPLMLYRARITARLSREQLLGNETEQDAYKKNQWRLMSAWQASWRKMDHPQKEGNQDDV